MTSHLARGLAASGVGVVAGIDDGIAASAHRGALELGAANIAVMSGGLSVACPAHLQHMHERVTRAGCAISELPHDCSGRRWGGLAAARIVAALGAVTVVVEAEQKPGDLFVASIARALGRPVAALPGRVTSPLSRGTHELLKTGAHLVCGPADVLELLFALDTHDPVAHQAKPSGELPLEGLREELQTTLQRVGAGYDTPDKLTRAFDGEDPDHTLTALSELELLGLLTRGDGGRYVPRGPAGQEACQ